MKRPLAFTFFILVAVNALGQYFQTGQDPASIRWRQINTQNFQLIYPDYFEQQAQKLAGTLETVYPYGSYSLKYSPEKMPVILHTQTVKSNGLVAWAPRRSEFYTTPHQDIYPQDWLEQLALHEFRHVVQLTKVNSNLPSWTKFLLGEQITALVFGAYLPWWLIEGDAVVTETALGNYGRGRFPSFLMEQKAQVIEKGVFSYDKAYLGSYREFVPDHYSMGYYLTGNLRARYGSSIVEEIFTRAGSHPFSGAPVRKVLKNHTGLNTAENYRSVFDSLRIEWQKEDQHYSDGYDRVVSKPEKYFTSYRYNHWLNDSTLVSYKTAFDRIASFVEIKADGTEKRIALPGTIFRESVSGRDDWIVWSEQVPDLRWQHSGRSVIRMFNASSKKQLKIIPEFKAFSPSLSPDKTKIAVVEADFSNNYYLSVYRVSDGELVHRFQSANNNYFFSPEWLDNENVATIILSGNGKRIASVDFTTNELRRLTQTDLGDVKQLRLAGDWLYFVSSYSGKNDLCRMNLLGKNIEKVYDSRFGVESPAISADGKSVVLSDYTSDGFRLIKTTADNDKVVQLQNVKKGAYLLAEKLAGQENGVPVFPDTISGGFVSKKYPKGKQLFNFHSWAPVYVDTQEYEFYPGVSLMSQDKLGISETVLGYKWDLAEGTGKFVADFSFKGWFPIIDVIFSYGKRASEYWQIMQKVNSQGTVVSRDTTLQRYTWGQTNSGLNIRLPLNLERGPFNRLLQPEIQYAFNYYKAGNSAPEQFQGGSFHSLGYRLYFHQLLKQSYLDMYPDFGFVVDGSFRHSPAGTLRAGQMKALQSVVYLPGFMKNHGVRLYGGVQKKEDSGAIGFSDIVRYARGWGRINTTSIFTGGIDYKMPLFYPDWNLGGIVYVKRVKASLFADYSRLKGNLYEQGKIAGTYTSNISSLGTEVTADVNLIRFYAPSSIGFRASYLPEMKDVYFNFLFSIDFTSF
ncbi:hypothetical protein SAMN05444274_101222 [Mariniphaga anaerophila]|uniref:WD40-like Beta Propeller Repeat n=1 Tax=Mariniphaga anaerophila TaxID=1484053 RepID=A0A1M4T117_9BACT|nr:hypothetical protein [Mariniphaga anaerophila]SHE38149.1 hypothetical protein SAMN05444274_101222 [Mariniphaga anaerophila]